MAQTLQVFPKSISNHSPLCPVATLYLQILAPVGSTHYFGYDGFDDQYEMYDLINDPEEMEDLYAAGNPIASGLKAELQGKIDQVNERYL